MEVIHAGKTGQLTVTHQPRIAVNFGRENKAAPERLIDKLVFKIIYLRRNTHSVIFRKTLQSVRVTASEHICAVMHGGALVVYQNIGVCFAAVPQKSGYVFFGFIKIQPVIQHDKVGGIFSAVGKHFTEQICLFGAKRSAYAVKLEQRKAVIAAEMHKKIIPRLLRLLRVAVAVGRTPKPHADAELQRGFNDFRVAVRILPAKLFAFYIAVCSRRAVEIARVPCVYPQLHAENTVHILKKSQIRQRLLLGRSFVRVVYP